MLVGWLLFGAAGRDDAHITYWPAYTLAHMGEILSYSGEALEQSSSLLQVVVLAVVHLVTGIDIVTLGRLLSIEFGVACLPFVYVLASQLHSKAGPIATLGTALTGPFVYWAFGGLESTLAAFCMLWVLLLLDRTLRAATVAWTRWGHLGLAMLATMAVRPEMPIVLLCVLAGIGGIALWPGFLQNVRPSRILSAALLLLGGAGLLFGGRYLYTGHFFPISVSSKAGGLSVDQIQQGIWYFQWQIWYPPSSRFGFTPLGYLAAGGVLSALGLVIHDVRTGKKRVLSALLLAYAVAYVSFIMLAGGDWMEGGRFLVPIMPVCMIFLGWGASRVGDVLAERGVGGVKLIRYALITVVLIACVLSTLKIAHYYNNGIPAWSREDFRAAYFSEEGHEKKYW